MATCKDCFNWNLCQGDAPYYSDGAKHCSSWLDPNNIAKVVRCKDCEYFTEHNDFRTGRHMGYGECHRLSGELFKDYDFCSYGERREGE